MTTERYQPPRDPFEGARAATGVLALELLRRWARRWLIWLPIAYLIGVVATDLNWIFWIALGAGGLSLAIRLLFVTFIRRKLPKGTPGPIDVEGESVTIDLDRIERR
ncbi:hypothetical protein [Sphingomicrobium flavum]|uniref:hypothetical protein n=1 Tax=Sphingomicrobium flavum TaxID=1229164 RepID=UPI0021AE2C8C|nr:hypothetical protein [Sphingomicrobium flavum]